MPTLIVPNTVVEGQSLNVGGLLELQHTIPPYQRDYVWTDKVIEELWNDLTSHYKRLAVNELLPNPEGYFLGAMVVVRDDAAGTFEVVDGQQRLTSLSTVVAVLFDLLATVGLDPNLLTGFEQASRSCLARFVGGEYIANLRFSDPEFATFFINSCLLEKTKAAKEAYWAGPQWESHFDRKKSTFRLLKGAIEMGYRKAAEFLEEPATPELKRERLTSFFRLVTECVVVLRIQAHSEAAAYGIFESLNNRGVRLSQADLIKNELLRVATAAEAEDVRDNWRAARQNVTATDILSLPDFLHFSYLSRHPAVKANALFQTVKSLIRPGGALGALPYSEHIAEDAGALDALTSNFDANWTSATHTMLTDINTVLGISLCYPFLFAAYRKHASTPTEFEAHVRLVMNFAFRYMKVLDGTVGVLAKAINQASMALTNGASLAELRGVLQPYAPDPEFIEKFREISFPNTKLAYFTVYYLELYRLNGTIPLPHGQESNLEHIMPRTPAPHWPSIAAAKQADPDEFSEYLWRVGNLLPLPQAINKALKNRPIGFKIRNPGGNDYVSSTLVSPTQVSEYLSGNDWTYKSIEARQADLANDAPAAWPL